MEIWTEHLEKITTEMQAMKRLEDVGKIELYKEAELNKGREFLKKEAGNIIQRSTLDWAAQVVANLDIFLPDGEEASLTGVEKRLDRLAGIDARVESLASAYQDFRLGATESRARILKLAMQ